MTVVFLHFENMWFPDDSRKMALWKRVALMVFHPFYAGNEAVILFFVLSGLVLSFPYLRGREQTYPRFLLRRVLRIYGPYLGALALALCGAAIWHGHAPHGAWASILWTRPVETRLVAQHLAFLGVYDDFQYDFVIWTLIQELRISILFPMVFLVTRRLGFARSLMLAASLSGVALLLARRNAGSLFHSGVASTLHYTAFFILGILVATNVGTMQRWWSTLGLGRRWAVSLLSFALYGYGLVLCGRVLLFIAHRYVPKVSTATIIEHWVVAAGAIGLLVVSIEAATARKMLTTVPARFLGRISYSLYLVHPIVLLSLTFACGTRLGMWAQLPLYLFLPLLAGWLFCRTVEEPFIRWSRAV